MYVFKSGRKLQTQKPLNLNNHDPKRLLCKKCRTRLLYFSCESDSPWTNYVTQVYVELLTIDHYNTTTIAVSYAHFLFYFGHLSLYSLLATCQVSSVLQKTVS